MIRTKKNVKGIEVNDFETVDGHRMVAISIRGDHGESLALQSNFSTILDLETAHDLLLALTDVIMGAVAEVVDDGILADVEESGS